MDNKKLLFLLKCMKIFLVVANLPTVCKTIFHSVGKNKCAKNAFKKKLKFAFWTFANVQ
jgi:hypothetical protein